MGKHRQLDTVKSANVIQFVEEMTELFRRKIGNKKNPVIIIHGGYGHNNLGDDALLLTTTKIVRQIYPDATIVSLEMIKYVMSCDGYIISGGGLSHSYYHKNKLRYLFEPRGKFSHLMTIFQNIRRVPMVIFFCGYHAIPDYVQKSIMKIALKHIPMLGVRDSYSGEFLSQIGINNYVIGYDPALLYEDYNISNDKKILEKYNMTDKNYVLLNVREVVNEEISKQAIEEIASFIVQFGKMHPDLYFVLQPYSVRDFSVENDLICNEKIKQYVLERAPHAKIVLLEGYQTFEDSKEKRMAFVVRWEW